MPVTSAINVPTDPISPDIPDIPVSPDRQSSALVNHRLTTGKVFAKLKSSKGFRQINQSTQVPKIGRIGNQVRVLSDPVTVNGECPQHATSAVKRLGRRGSTMTLSQETCLKCCAFFVTTKNGRDWMMVKSAV